MSQLSNDEESSDDEPDSPATTLSSLSNRSRIHKLYATRQTLPVKVVTNKEAINLMTPNGTGESILHWSMLTNLDKRQQKAFTAIVASFVLTFYTDPETDGERLSELSQQRYEQERVRLQQLVRVGFQDGDQTYTQMIMLLHGPGGSGKSTVIELVCDYARRFCDNIDYPFTGNTIVITAMSGVAATLLGGNTTHKKCAIRRKVNQADIDQWKGTRLIVVDEISFASAEDLEKMDQKL